MKTPTHDWEATIRAEYACCAKPDKLVAFVRTEIEAAEKRGEERERERAHGEFLAIKALGDVKNQGQHLFTESNKDERFVRTIFCLKCGIVSWHFNFSESQNKLLQEKARETRCGELAAPTNTV